MAFQAGSIFAELELDTSPLSKGLKDASRAINDFQKQVEAKIKQATTPLTPLQKRIKALGAAFINLRKVGVRTFGILKVVSGALLSPFKLVLGFLTKSIFNLKNLIIVIAAAAFVRRAKQVEAISTAFDNLSQGVGIVASEFLPALREALKGTVSDLDLMRTTNNAMLLGVVQSQEQFAELAVVARRLGRAVGRNAVDALNDLAVGIGRQSRLILDNLGIIISVDKAYRDFAATLGLNADELTDNQKRQAFLNATMEISKRKLKSLGPDVLTVADQWDRLTASINNTIDALATSLVGGNLPSDVADFIDENLQKIVASAAAAQLAIVNIVKSIAGIIADAFGGDRLVELLFEGVRSAIKVVSVVLFELVKILAPVLLDAFLELGRVSGRAFVDGFKAFFVGDTTLQDFLLPLQGGGPERRARLRNLPPELRSGAASSAETSATSVEQTTSRIIKSGKAVFESLLGEIKRLQGEIGRETEKIQLGFQGIFTPALARIADAIKFTRDLIERDFSSLGDESVGRLFELTLTDPIFGFRKIVTNQVIQPLANAINFAEEFSRQLGTRRPDLFTVDQINQGRRLIGLLGGATNEVNKLINAFKKLTTRETIDPAKFAELLKPFTDQAKKLQLQIDTLGASAKEANEATFKSVTSGQPPLDDELNQTQILKDAIRLANSEKARLTLKQQLVNVTNQIRDVEAATLVVGLDLEEAAKERADFLVKGADALSDQVRQAMIALGIAQQQNKEENDLLQAREELIESTTQIIGQGVTEGILQGKIAFKDVAEVGANLFRNFMSKAIDNIGKKLSQVLENVLGSQGAVGLAGALIGIGGLIISNLQGKTEATIDDFGDQVSSSEAVRGVVAGPTNVAISKVGNQLKDALRVSEGLLLRIANAVESGGGGGGGGAGDTGDNLSVLLSGSTPS